MSVRLMVVEDTDHVRTMLVDILLLHGFSITAEAANGDEALQLLDAAEPDVVVVDLKMPGMDGLELSSKIRERRGDQHIIIYSAYLDDAIEEQAREIGVAVCVPKLAGVEDLAREITAVAMDLGSTRG